MKNLLKQPALVLKTMMAGAFMVAITYASPANASLAKDSYLGPYTGNCYCNVTGTDCHCVIIIKEEVE